MDVATLRVRLEGDSRQLVSSLKAAGSYMASFQKASQGASVVVFEGDTKDLQSASISAQKELSAFQKAAGTSSEVHFTADTKGLSSATRSGVREMTAFKTQADKNSSVNLTADSRGVTSGTRSGLRSLFSFKRDAAKNKDVNLTADAAGVRSGTQQASKTLSSWKSNSKKNTTVNLDADESGVRAATAAATRDVANFKANASRNSTVVFDADTSSYNSALAGAEDQTSSFLGFGNSLKMFFGTLAGGALIGGAAASIFGFNSQMQQSDIAFSTMLGSGRKAEKFLKDLAQFAKTTPFEFPDLVDASRQMLAFGFSAEDVMPLLTSVGNTASAMGLSGSEGIGRMVYALGQMKAATVVQLGEINQLTEMGVPAYDILAKAVGTTTKEAKQMASEGQIASDVFINAFETFAQGKYGDMMAKQSLTFAGAMSTIKDVSVQTGAAIVRPFFLIAAAVVRVIATLVSSTGLGPVIKGVWDTFTGFAGSLYGTATAIDHLSRSTDLAQTAVELLPKSFQGIATSIGSALSGMRKFTGNVINVSRVIADAVINGEHMDDWLTHLPKGWHDNVASAAAFAAKMTDVIFGLDRTSKSANKQNSIWQRMTPLQRQIVRGADSIATSLRERLATAYDKVSQKASKAGKSIRQSVSEHAAQVFHAVAVASIEAARGFVKFANSSDKVASAQKIAQDAVNALPAPVRNLANSFAFLVHQVARFASGMVKVFTPVLQGFISRIGEIAQPLKQRVYSMLDAAFGKAARKRIVDDISAWQKGISGVFQRLGERLREFSNQLPTHIGPGMKKGLKKAGAEWADAAVNAVSNMVKAVKKFLGISSPAKLFISIGGFIVSGLIRGLTMSPALLIAAGITAAAVIYDAIKGYFENRDLAKMVGGMAESNVTQGGETKQDPQFKKDFKQSVNSMDVDPAVKKRILADYGITGKEAGNAFSQAMDQSIEQNKGFNLQALLAFPGNLLAQITAPLKPVFNFFRTAGQQIFSAISEPLAKMGELFMTTGLFIWKSMAPALNNLKIGFQNILPFIKMVSEVAGYVLLGALESIVPLVGFVLVAAVNGLALAFRLLGTALGWIATKLAPLQPAFNLIGRIIGWVFGTVILGGIGKVLKVLGTFFERVGLGIQGVQRIAVEFGEWGQGVTWITPWALRVGKFLGKLPGMGTLVGRAFEYMGKVLYAAGKVFNFFSITADRIFSALGKGLDWIVSKFRTGGLEGVFSGIGNALKSFASNIPGWLGDAAGAFAKFIWNMIKAGAQAVWSGLKYFGREFMAGWNEARGVISNVPATIERELSTIPNILGRLWQFIKDLISALGVTLKNAGQDLWKRLVDVDWAALFNTVKQGISSAAKGIWNFIKGLFTGGKGKGGDSQLKLFDEDDGKNMIQGLIQGIRMAAGGVGQVLVKLAVGAFNAFVQWWMIRSPSKKMMQAGKQIVDGLVQAFKAAPGVLGRALVSLGPKLIKAVVSIGSKLGNALAQSLKKNFPQAFKVLQQMGQNIRQNMASWINVVKQNMRILSTAIKVAWNIVRITTLRVWAGIKAVLSGAWKVIHGIFTGNLKQIRTGLQQAWNGMKMITSSVWNAIKALFNVFWQAAKAIFNNSLNAVKQAMSNAWNNIKSLTSKAFEAVKNFISDKLETARKNAIEAVTNLKEGAMKIFNAMPSPIQALFKKIGSFITDPVQTAKDTLISAFTAIIDFINKVLSAVHLPTINISGGDSSGKTTPANKRAGNTHGTSPNGTVTGFARGGLFKADRGGIAGPGRMGLVGEAGHDEAIVNLQKKTPESQQAFRAAAQSPNAPVARYRDEGGFFISGRGEGLGPTNYNLVPEVRAKAEGITGDIPGTTWNTYTGHGNPGGSISTYTFDVWGSGGRGSPIGSAHGYEAANLALGKYNDGNPPVLYIIRQGEMWRNTWGGWRPWPQDPHMDHTHISYTPPGGERPHIGDGTSPVVSLWDTVGNALWNSLVQPKVDALSNNLTSSGLGIAGSVAAQVTENTANQIKDYIIGESGTTSGGSMPGGASPKGLTILEAATRGGFTGEAARHAGAVIWRESNGNAHAQNPSGARGLMQIMPDTAKGIGVDYARLYDPIYNTSAGHKLYMQSGWSPWNASDAAGLDYSHLNDPVTGYARGGIVKGPGIVGETGDREAIINLDRKTRESQLAFAAALNSPNALHGFATGGLTFNGPLANQAVNVARSFWGASGASFGLGPGFTVRWHSGIGMARTGNGIIGLDPQLSGSNLFEEALGHEIGHAGKLDHNWPPEALMSNPVHDGDRPTSAELSAFGKNVGVSGSGTGSTGGSSTGGSSGSGPSSGNWGSQSSSITKTSSTGGSSGARAGDAHGGSVDSSGNVTQGATAGDAHAGIPREQAARIMEDQNATLKRMEKLLKKMPDEIGEKSLEAQIRNLAAGTRHRRALTQAYAKMDQLRNGQGMPLNRRR